MQLAKIWDGPTRLFHWLLVISIGAQYITAEWLSDAMQWHFYIGYFTLGLVLFRLFWGVIGTTYAKFSSFIYPPRSIVEYCKTLPARNSKHYAGHNPAGGVVVVLLLVMIALQAISGLFMTDDVFLDGPYRYMASDKVLDIMSAIHNQLFWVIVGFVALHICAVLFYVLYKKQPLIRAMFSGKKPVDAISIAHSKWLIAFVVIILTAALIYVLVAVFPNPPAVEAVYF